MDNAKRWSTSQQLSMGKKSGRDAGTVLLKFTTHSPEPEGEPSSTQWGRITISSLFVGDTMVAQTVETHTREDC